MLSPPPAPWRRRCSPSGICRCQWISRLAFCITSRPKTSAVSSRLRWPCLLLGAGGFVALARVPRPSRWAALSAAAPPILLAVSYWRIAAFGLDLDWTAVALALAALELAAAYWAAQHRDGEAENELVLAAYAVGVLGCTILAAVFVLENAWLTVTLALHLPALAWVEGRLQLPVLRNVALGIAATVLIRLTLNPEVVRYGLPDTLIFNWLLYGYGVPAAAFI